MQTIYRTVTITDLESGQSRYDYLTDGEIAAFQQDGSTLTCEDNPVKDPNMAPESWTF